MNAISKIGFIVEGDSDKAIVEALGRRLLGKDFELFPVRLGNTIALPWAYATVLTLLEEKHCQHVILVLDADAVLERDVERKRCDIESMLIQHRLEKDEFTVCLAV